MGPGSHLGIADSANGIRTRVPALRGLCPRPLDDSAAHVAGREHKEPPPLYQQARQESNLQPPVLETGALPIELRTFIGRRDAGAQGRRDSRRASTLLRLCAPPTLRLLRVPDGT